MRQDKDQLPQPVQNVIGLMIEVSKTMPDDFFAVPAGQELARVAAAYNECMSTDDFATLVAVGAVLVKHGKTELEAGIQAHFAIKNARDGQK